MTDQPLSPAAQAVWDAVRIHWEEWPEKDHRWRIACSIRAAADQVGEWESAEELRAIADELEAQ